MAVAAFLAVLVMGWRAPRGKRLVPSVDGPVVLVPAVPPEPPVTPNLASSGAAPLPDGGGAPVGRRRAVQPVADTGPTTAGLATLGFGAGMLGTTVALADGSPWYAVPFVALLAVTFVGSVSAAWRHLAARQAERLGQAAEDVPPPWLSRAVECCLDLPLGISVGAPLGLWMLAGAAVGPWGTVAALLGCGVLLHAIGDVLERLQPGRAEAAPSHRGSVVPSRVARALPAVCKVLGAALLATASAWSIFRDGPPLGSVIVLASIAILTLVWCFDSVMHPDEESGTLDVPVSPRFYELANPRRPLPPDVLQPSDTPAE